MRRMLIAPILALALGSSVAEPPARDPRVEAALAQGERLESLLEAIRERLSALPAFELTFQQRFDSVTFGSEEEARGTVLVRRPDRMLWTYAAPDRREGVYDGRTWWLVDRKEKHVTRRDSGPDDLVAGMLTGRLRISTLFAVRPSDEPAGERSHQRLELVPREPRDDVDVVFLDVDPKANDLRRVIVQDPLGNRFIYAFGPPKGVRPPPDSVFRVEIPDGWTVAYE